MKLFNCGFSSFVKIRILLLLFGSKYIYIYIYNSFFNDFNSIDYNI